MQGGNALTDRWPCANPNCDRPTNQTICPGCQGQLRNALQQLPGLLAELEVTTTRQAVTTRGGGGVVTKASEEPIPFDVDASEMDWVVRNTVTTWARDIVEEHYGRLPAPVPGPTCVACFHPSCAEIRTRIDLHRKATPPKHFAALCGWIAHHLPWIVQQPWAQQIHDEITSIRPFANRTVDNREDRYAGPCTAQVVALDLIEADGLVGFDTADRQCGADLRLRSGAQRIVCRACGADYDAADRAHWISKQSADQLATAALIAQALTEAAEAEPATNVAVKAATIRKWAQRTREVDARNARRLPDDAFEVEPHPIRAARWPDLPEGPTCRQAKCAHESCCLIRVVLARVPEYRVGDVYERVKARPNLSVVGERMSA